MLCVHCGLKEAKASRGLCYTCYRQGDIRTLYRGASSKYAVHGVGNDNAEPPACQQATDAPPGSVEKLDTLAARAERGEALYHPADAKDWDGRSGQLLMSGDGPRAA